MVDDSSEPTEEDAILGNKTTRERSNSLGSFGEGEGNPWAETGRPIRAPPFNDSVFGLLCVALPLGLVAGYANILFLVSRPRSRGRRDSPWRSC